MSLKKTPKKKTEYNEDKVRVRNSYYTFSKEYPSKNILHIRKGVRKRTRRNRFLKILTGLIAFVFIALSAYAVSDLLLRISYKPLDTSLSQSDEKNSLTLSRYRDIIIMMRKE